MSLSILFVPLDSTGHINACIGVAEKLLACGHTVVFAIERAWTGKLSQLGFKEALYTDPTRPPNLGPNEYWLNSMDLIADVLPEDSLYKAGHQDVIEFEELVLNAFHFDDQLASIIEAVQPDVIVSDNYTTVPAIYKSGRKWVQMTSAGPLAVIPHPDTPPGGSGYPTAGDRSQWTLFESTLTAHYGPSIEKYFTQLKETYGITESPPEGLLFHPSPYLNIYAYPEELDYLDIRPLPPKWRRFDHFIRSSAMESVQSFEIPEKLKRLPGKLVYVSMGSMGCASFPLMSRLVDMASQSAHRFIMVLGPNVDKFPSLPANVWGGKTLPQIAILPHVDVIVTHGGNNSVLEGLLFGKPLIINPLFADQYDNAQRIFEKGLGYRINAFKCQPEELLELIDKVVEDPEIYKRLEPISKRLANSKSTEKAAEAIVELVKGGPSTWV